MHTKNIKLLILFIFFVLGTSTVRLVAFSSTRLDDDLSLLPQDQLEPEEGRSLLRIIWDNKVILGSIAGGIVVLAAARVYCKKSADDHGTRREKDVPELLTKEDVRTFEDKFNESIKEAEKAALRNLFKEYDVFTGKEDVVKKCLNSSDTEARPALEAFLSCLPGFKDVNLEEDFKDLIPSLASFFKTYKDMIITLIESKPENGANKQGQNAPSSVQDSTTPELIKMIEATRR